MSRLICRQCGAAYGGSQASGGHCTGGCHRSFRSQGAFDKHRTRDFTCIDVANTPPWRETDTGWTPYPPNTRFPARQATFNGRTGASAYNHTSDDPDAGNRAIDGLTS